MRWLRKIWYSRLRKIDLKILWPICKEKAGTLDEAKAAFAYHAFNDEAWISLGADETARQIDDLK